MISYRPPGDNIRDNTRIIIMSILLILLCLTPRLVNAQESTGAQDPTGAQNPQMQLLEEKLAEVYDALNQPNGGGIAMAKSVEDYARSLPVSSRSFEVMIEVIRLQARALHDAHRFDEALIELNRALSYPVDPASYLMADLIRWRGVISRGAGHFGQALEDYQVAFEIYKNGDRADLQRSLTGQIMSLHEISTLHTDARQYEKAIVYSQRASAISYERFYPLFHYNAARNVSKAYLGLRQYDEAHDCLEQALTYQVELDIPKERQFILGELAKLELARDDIEAAQKYVTAALKISEEYNEQEKLWQVYGTKAEIEFRKNNLQSARISIERSFGDLDIQDTPIEFRGNHETAAKIYQKLGEYPKALTHQIAFKRLEDAADLLVSDVNTALLRTEFEIAQKEVEIEQLRNTKLESDIALAKAERQNTQTRMITAAIIIMTILSFLGWNVYIIRKSFKITQSLNAELLITNADLAQASQIKTELLATTSHEVRTPLNAIIGLTDVILEAKEINDQSRDYVEIINASGQNLLQILTDMLDLSKLEAGRVHTDQKPLDIAECALDVAELWRNPAEDKGLKYNVIVDRKMGEYLCNERFIRQIVSNLLSNAIKFTHRGEVGLTVKASDEQGVVIAVKDSGIGIAADQQSMVFESFRQVDNSHARPYGGTGLGLAICQKIVEEMGGNIVLVSQLGEGAEFIVNLPLEAGGVVNTGLEPAQMPPLIDPIERTKKELSVLRILVAEDNPANALLLCAMLNNQVAQIEVVEDGAAAVEAIQQRHFDVVLMDRQMPIMNGDVATRKIRKLPPPHCNIPIIGVTAAVLIGSKEDCLQSGMDDYLTKPVNSSALKSAIIGAVSAKRKITKFG